MSDLTKTQTKRLAARIQGESLSAIAASEGCTKQAIAKTLAAPAVRQAAFAILGRKMVAENADTGEEVDIISEALKTIAQTMTNATRPVVLTQTISGSTIQHIEYVPDYPTRLAAATRLINLVDKPAPAISIEQERETVTTHTKERMRVDAG